MNLRELIQLFRRATDVSEIDKYRDEIICHMTRNGKPSNELINLRVDRFLSVDILANQKALDIRKLPEYQNGSFQLNDYMRQHLYMVSGETVHVKMQSSAKALVTSSTGTERILEL